MLTVTVCVAVPDWQPLALIVNVMVLVPPLPHVTVCGPAPVPGTAVPPPKFQLKVAPGGAEPVKVTVEDPLMQMGESTVKLATGVGFTVNVTGNSS